MMERIVMAIISVLIFLFLWICKKIVVTLEKDGAPKHTILKVKKLLLVINIIVCILTGYIIFFA